MSIDINPCRGSGGVTQLVELLQGWKIAEVTGKHCFSPIGIEQEVALNQRINVGSIIRLRKMIRVFCK